MRKGVRASTLAVLSLAVAGFGLTGCGLKEPPAFDPIVVSKPESDASGRNKSVPHYIMPTQFQDLTTQPAGTEDDLLPPTPATQPVNRHLHLRPLNDPSAANRHGVDDNNYVRMPLQSIMQRSVAYSAEVRVSGYDPAIAKTRILEAEARFDPVMFMNLKYEHQDVPFAGQTIQNPLSTTTTETLFVERGEVYTLEPGIKQVLPSGAELSLSYQLQYNYLLPRRFVLNPYWDDQLKLQLTQPLLRNAGLEVNQARITIARNDTHVAILDYRKALEDNIAELEKDYWQLEEAEQEVIIQEHLLDETRKTSQIIFQQFIKGAQQVSRVQTSQAQASIRSRQVVLIRARARLRDISDDIKRRMNDPNFPVAGPEVIMPLEIPSDHKLEFDEKEQVDTALANRLELGQQSLRINDADVALNVALNNAYPKLDLTAAITLEGLNSNEGKTLRSQWENDGHVGYSFGFAFELPIGNREARSIIRRAQLQRLQAIEQYRNLVGQITLDVTTAMREVNTTWNEMAGRRQARFAQADELDAYETRRVLGDQLTPTFVQLLLDAQERLADAEREEQLAVASYQVAIARLERSKGTLLRYNNVVLAEDTFKGMER